MYVHLCIPPSLQDNFLRRCKKKVESIQEKDLWVEGAFMSEQDMKDEKFPEHLSSTQKH